MKLFCFKCDGYIQGDPMFPLISVVLAAALWSLDVPSAWYGSQDSCRTFPLKAPSF